MPKQKWPILTRKGGLTTEKQHVVLSYKVPVQHSLLLVYYFHLEFRISNRLVIGFRVGKSGYKGCNSPKILTPTGSVASPNSKMKVAVACKSQKILGHSFWKTILFVWFAHISDGESSMLAEWRVIFWQLCCLHGGWTWWSSSHTSFWCCACSAPLCVMKNTSYELKYLKKPKKSRLCRKKNLLTFYIKWDHLVLDGLR